MKSLTPWVLTSVIVLLVVYDIWAAASGGADTLSAVVQDFGLEHPSVILAAGYLLGHFWPIRSRLR